MSIETTSRRDDLTGMMLALFQVEVGRLRSHDLQKLMKERPGLVNVKKKLWKIWKSTHFKWVNQLFLPFSIANC